MSDDNPGAERTQWESRAAAPVLHIHGPELEALLEAAIKRGVTAGDLRAQRHSCIAGEAAMGNDADEAAYRAAYERGDEEEMARLDAEGEKRRQRALKRMQEMGL